MNITPVSWNLCANIRRGRRFLPIAALMIAVALTVFVYWPGSHGGFVLDDYANIVDNPAVHIHDLDPANLLAAAFSSRAGALHRPLSMLSFAFNEALWGPSPYSMKVTNILIHAANGLLVYAVVVLLLTAYRCRCRPDLDSEHVQWTAVAITTAWLLLPINLTAVLYVVQRMTSMSGTFVLGGIAMYLLARLRMLHGHSGRALLWTGMLVFGGLAVLAKESGALLPVYTLAIEFTLFRFTQADGRRDRQLYLFYTAFLLLPGVLGLLWIMPHAPSLSDHAGRPFTLGQRLLTEPRVVLDYIFWSLTPTLPRLSLYHDDYSVSHGLLHPPMTLVAILTLAALFMVALHQRRRRPLLSLGILWFFGGQLLTATIFNLELVYEHRNYLPTLGLLVATFCLLLLDPGIHRMPRARQGFVGGLIVLYAVITTFRVQEWSDPIRYQAIAAAEHPDSPRAAYALGRTYSMLIDGPDSTFITLARKAFQAARRAPGDSILPEQGLIWLSARFHKPVDPAWWDSMEEKLSNYPASSQNTMALYYLVTCQLNEQCELPKARMIRVFKTALARNPRNPDIVSIYANYTLNVLEEPAHARKLMLRVLDLSPKTPQYWINLIKLDIYLGRFQDAQREIYHLHELSILGSLDKAISAMETRLAEAERNSSLPATGSKLVSQGRTPRLGKQAP